MGILESLLGPLIGFLADLIGGALSLRAVVRLRVGVWEDSKLGIASAGTSTSIWSRDGALWIHNSGRQTFTVNEAGWVAQDGTHLKGKPEYDASTTLLPGGPELRYTLPAVELVELNNQHGGIVRIYLQLAGARKPRRQKVPSGWIGELRAMADKPTTVHRTYW